MAASKKTNRDDLRSDLNAITRICARLSHFLRKAYSDDHPDPFLLGLNLLIEDENEIHQLLRDSPGNNEVYKELRSLKSSYQQEYQRSPSASEPISFEDVYRNIDFLAGLPLIKIQYDALQQFQRTRFETSQRNILVDGSNQCSTESF